MYPPDQAIEIAAQQAELGYAHPTSKFNDELREHFRLVGEEATDKLHRVLYEIPPESYKPPFELNDPPGCPFVFQSSILGCEIYFKFQILGATRKPKVLFWSCHPPLY